MPAFIERYKDHRVAPVLAALDKAFAGVDFQARALLERGDAQQDQVCLRVEPDRLLEVMRFLYADAACRFDQLADLAGVDYLNFPKARDRFAITYNLLSVPLGHRLWVKCFANDPDPVVPSVVSIWKGANWMEREVWDMFGIRFEGHPDLRRILTWEGFGAHPLRKDYPLQGRGERENYEVLDRESA